MLASGRFSSMLQFDASCQRGIKDEQALSEHDDCHRRCGGLGAHSRHRSRGVRNPAPPCPSGQRDLQSVSRRVGRAIQFTPPLLTSGTATTEKMVVKATLGNSASPCVTTAGIAVTGTIKGTMTFTGAKANRCSKVFNGLSRVPTSTSKFKLTWTTPPGAPTRVEAAARLLGRGCTRHDQPDRHRRKGHGFVLTVCDSERHALGLELGERDPHGLRIDRRALQPDTGYLSRYVVVRRRV